MDELGRLDALVNNAGITRDAMLHKMTEAQWRQVIDVNLTGVFFCLQFGAGIMSAAGGGSIVNISSDARYGNPGQANYSAAKAGIIGLHQNRGQRARPKERAGKCHFTRTHQYGDAPGRSGKGHAENSWQECPWDAWARWRSSAN